MISHVKLQTEIVINIPYVSVPRWRQGFKMLWIKMSGHLKDAFGKKTYEKERQERL